MRRISWLAAVAIVFAACGTGTGGDQTTSTIDQIPTEQTPPSATQQASTTTATAPLTSTATADVGKCPLPQPITGVGDGWFVALHAAVASLAEHTNQVADALLEVDDFTARWENREPVASPLGLLYADFFTVEVLASRVLEAEYGATQDAHGGWNFPPATQPVPPAISHLTEIANAPRITNEQVMPPLFDARTQTEAVSMWTTGPCGMAATLVQLIDNMATSGVFNT